MIEICDLNKRYQKNEVLKDVTLKIEKGSIHGLVGFSGAGKSTLLKCINLLEDYYKGSIVIDGTDIKSLDNKCLRVFRKEIGMIFQHFSLLERKSVFANVALPLKCRNMEKKEREATIMKLLDIVGLSEKNAFPRALSGGEKQRVAIARALVLNPKILLCDEATSALDPKTTHSIIELLKSINKKLGITIVVVSHEISVVQSLCDEISILECGRIAESGSVKEVF